MAVILVAGIHSQGVRRTPAKTFWFASFEYTNPNQQFLQQLRIPNQCGAKRRFLAVGFWRSRHQRCGHAATLIPLSSRRWRKALLADPSLLPTTDDPNGRFSWLGSQSDNVKATIVKLDHQFSDKHRAFLSMFRRIDNQIRDPLLGIQIWRTHSSGEGTSAYQHSVATYAFNDTYTFNSHMLNNLIVGITHLNAGPIRSE